MIYVNPNLSPLFFKYDIISSDVTFALSDEWCCDTFLEMNWYNFVEFSQDTKKKFMMYECWSVSNHWQVYHLFKSLFMLISKKKIEATHYWRFVGVIQWRTSEFHHKGPVMRRALLYYDVIMFQIPTSQTRRSGLPVALSFQLSL